MTRFVYGPSDRQDEKRGGRVWSEPFHIWTGAQEDPWPCTADDKRAACGHKRGEGREMREYVDPLRVRWDSIEDTIADEEVCDGCADALAYLLNAEPRNRSPLHLTPEGAGAPRRAPFYHDGLHESSTGACLYHHRRPDEHSDNESLCGGYQAAQSDRYDAIGSEPMDVFGWIAERTPNVCDDCLTALRVGSGCDETRFVMRVAEAHRTDPDTEGVWPSLREHPLPFSDSTLDAVCKTQSDRIREDALPV